MNVSPADVDPINKRNLKALENGGKTEFWQAGSVVLIGAGHKAEIVEEVKKTGWTGKITITKGSGTNPGSLEVTGAKSGRREFEDTVARFSKKKVGYK